MSFGSRGRLFVWSVRDAVCANEPPGRAAQKLVRRHNNVHDQCASESVLSLVTESSASSWTRPPRREAGPAAGRELLGATRATRARGATLPQQKSVHRRRRRFRAAARAAATSKSGRDAVAAPRRRDQHPRPRAAALRRSPRATTKRRPIRRSTRPRAAAAPRGNASRRHKMCLGPAVGRRRRRGHGPELLRVPDVHGSRRARLAPQRPSGRTTGPNDRTQWPPSTRRSTLLHHSVRLALARLPGEGGRGASRRFRP